MRLNKGISRRLVGDKLTVEFAERILHPDEPVAVLTDLDAVLNLEEQDWLRHVLL
jgi:hypothetical protein